MALYCIVPNVEILDYIYMNTWLYYNYLSFGNKMKEKDKLER